MTLRRIHISKRELTWEAHKKHFPPKNCQCELKNGPKKNFFLERKLISKKFNIV
jgi:hypothetical protein